MGARAGVDAGILHHGKSTTCVQGLCVRAEVDMMAENRVHTYRGGSTSGAPSCPPRPELVRRYRHPRSGSLVHPHVREGR